MSLDLPCPYCDKRITRLGPLVVCWIDIFHADGTSHNIGYYYFRWFVEENEAVQPVG